MARIRQKGTKIENLVAFALRQRGLHYRRNVKGLPGSPDFANQTRRWAVFVNGCFWHHHTGCRKASIPKSNVEFWIDKFRANRRRDAVAIRKLRAVGYKVAIVWECEAGRADRQLFKILVAGSVDGR
jgi:DNA mismatch endonuclease Vsr